MKTKLPFMLCVFLVLSSSFYIKCSGQNAAVPIPLVTGPVTEPGSIFCASTFDLSPFGYIEEEYFIEGKAHRYNFKTNPTNAIPDPGYPPGGFYVYLEGIPGIATPIDTLYTYKTRIIVRRPADSKKFNGSVLVEWLNVSSMYDINPDWWHLHDYLMRSGYAWVGVSAQSAGIHSPAGLRKWNPERYGTLDVSANSTLKADELCYDIYSQAAMALKGESEVRPLSDLKPEIIIASGHSQSAFMLTAYYNFIQPIAGIIDGFIILGAGGRLRTDVPAKVFKINSETDILELNQVTARQPDNDRIITWEFSGTSHFDQTLLDFYSAMNKRDFGSFTPLECKQPLCSAIPFYYGFSAAVNHLNRWIREKIVPPAGIPITVLQTKPEVIIARDTFGNAQGGIRLPQFDVPIAKNTGTNSGESFFCRFYGTHQEFDQKTLKTLYPTHKIYLEKFNASVQENLRAGYILKEDASKMLTEARNLSPSWKKQDFGLLKKSMIE